MQTLLAEEGPPPQVKSARRLVEILIKRKILKGLGEQRFSIILHKMNVILDWTGWTLEFRQETNETLICCTTAEIDIGGFLGVTLLWIRPIHQNMCRTQSPRVGSRIDNRDNRFVYGHVTLPL